MKTSFKRVVSLGLITPLLFAGAVYAEGTNSGSGSSGNSTTTTNSTPSSDDKNKTKTENETESEKSTDDKGLSGRLQERKTKLKTSLTNTEKLRIQNRCKNSQGKFSSLDGRIKGMETSRGKVYSNITTRLTELEAKLKAKGADTTQLNTQIAELKTKVDKYNADLTTYKQAVSDLASMDCAADPTAFKASLETARAALLTVKQDAVAIKTYVTQTIKPTLQQIKSQLEKESTSDDSAQGTTGGNQ